MRPLLVLSGEGRVEYREQDDHEPQEEDVQPERAVADIEDGLRVFGAPGLLPCLPVDTPHQECGSRQREDDKPRQREEVGPVRELPPEKKASPRQMEGGRSVEYERERAMKRAIGLAGNGPLTGKPCVP